MIEETFKLTFPYANKFANKEKVNIKFFAGMIPNIYWDNQLWINPSSWFIKCYYDLNGNFPNRLSWKTPQLNDSNLSVDDFLKIIEEEDIDIVCLGLYLWNHSRYSNLGKEIKKRRPSTIILAGGPEVDVHKTSSTFWETHDFVDVVVYGDGEEAFTTLIDSMFDINSVKLTPCNFVYKQNESSINVGYRRFNDPEYKTISPYLHNKEDIANTIKNLRETSNVFPIINWEFTRGCPFSCTFCDWSSGLHHKTYRKTYDYKADLDFFNEIDLVANWIDANIGIHKEDVEIVDTALTLKKVNPKFELRLSNYSKVKKHVVYSLIEKLEQQSPGSVTHTIAIQDISSEILKNISRPDVPWDEHKQLLIDVKQRNPQIKFMIELIIGLPGQTLDSYANMLLEFATLDVYKVAGSLFNFLPNSPAASPEYIDKFKLKINELGYLHSTPENFKTLQELNENLNSSSWTKSKFVTDTMSATFANHVAMIGMSYFYNSYADFCKNKKWNINTKHFSNALRSKNWITFGEKCANDILKNKDIFGFPMILVETLDGPQSFYTYFNQQKNWIQFLK
jgi:radical SAM superfamily enzyme YgiQ (UPF0313 family)